MVCAFAVSMFFSKTENKRRMIYVGISGLVLMLFSVLFGAVTLGPILTVPITAYSQDVNGDGLLDIVYEKAIGRSALLQKEDGTYISKHKQFPRRFSTTAEEWKIIQNIMEGYDDRVMDP